MSGPSQRLLHLYHTLLRAFGPQHWWPGESAFEMMVGAILTQSVAWTNVEKAILNLKASGVLSPQALREIAIERLAELVRPSGYYRAKAAKIKALVEHLDGYGDDLDRFFDKDLDDLRTELLGIHGVGEETADAIILYAAEKPTFVIDAYTVRILDRLDLSPASPWYGAYKAWLEQHLPGDAGMFNEYHALLVRLGKDFCKKTPNCTPCPLLSLCPTGQARATAIL
jgi:endonuclease-3 related protein